MAESLLRSDYLGRAKPPIHPYICRDLKGAKPVPFYTFTETILGLSSKKMSQWALAIRKHKWFEHQTVQRAMYRFCDADRDWRRWEPFVNLANLIIELAPKHLPGMVDYPIEDFCFAQIVRSSDLPDEKIADADVNRPHVLGMRRAATANIESGEEQLTDILTFCQLKGMTTLTKHLNSERTDRGLPELEDDYGCLKETTVDGGVSRRGRKRKPVVKYTSRAAPSRSKVPSVYWKKRKRMEEDLLVPIKTGESFENSRPDRGTSDFEQYLGWELSVDSAYQACNVMTASQGSRLFCFNMTLKDDRIFLWYHDPSGTVYTTEFLSLIHDFEKAAALIVSIACCTPEQFGVLPNSIMHPATPYPASFPPASLQDNSFSMEHPTTKRTVGVTLKEPIFAQYGLVGRRTFLYSIETDPKQSDQELTVKFSYQASNRPMEHELLKVAKEAKVQHLPEAHMWADMWNLSDGVRAIFYDESGGEAEYQDRTLRAIVYTRYNPIQPLFTDRCDLIPVMVDQMIDCLHDLRYKANMLHRDISVNNIMYEKQGDDYRFILIDFDMAVVLSEGPEALYPVSPTHRTGTLAFMAGDLVFAMHRTFMGLDDPRTPHYLRHDYESLYWVSMWCVLTLLTKGLKPRHAAYLLHEANDLHLGSLRNIACCKLATCTTPFRDLPPVAKPLTLWFLGWNQAFLDSSSQIRGRRVADRRALLKDEDEQEEEDGSFDYETANGTFTRDALKAYLNEK